MVPTPRQQARFVKAEEEAEFNHWTNLGDTMIIMENSREAEGTDCVMGHTNDKE